jgi:DNA-binding SARP family transcriptional activator
MRRKMARLTVQTLGGICATAPAGAEIVFPTRKAAALLAYLAVESNRPHVREELVALLWPETEAARGRANLRQTLTRLRRALPEAAGSALKTRKESLAVATEALVCDWDDFQAALDEGDPRGLERAAALYRGPFLAGLVVEAEPFAGWLEDRRRLAEEQVQEALRRLLDHYVAAGRIDLAVASALRLLDFDPLQEAVHRTLMELYASCSRTSWGSIPMRKPRHFTRDFWPVSRTRALPTSPPP